MEYTSQAKRSQPVAGWTWKHKDLHPLCPEISADIMSDSTENPSSNPSEVSGTYVNIVIP